MCHTGNLGKHGTLAFDAGETCFVWSKDRVKVVPGIETLGGEKKTTKQSQSLGVYCRALDLH